MLIGLNGMFGMWFGNESEKLLIVYCWMRFVLLSLVWLYLTFMRLRMVGVML